MLPNIPPKLFSFSAVVIGYILIDDTTANEQNAMGNWLMLVAQVLSTNAFYRAVMQERGLDPRESTETGRNNSQVVNNIPFNDTNDINQTVQMLQKMVNAMQQEIENIKREL